MLFFINKQKSLTLLVFLLYYIKIKTKKEETMKETLIFIIVVIVLYLIVLFVIIRPSDKGIKKQKKFLEVVSQRAKNLLNKESKDDASRFIERMFSTIIGLHEEAFEGFEKLSNFVSHIGDDYSDEESIDRFLNKKYKKEDIKRFTEYFLETISN